jgi:outer membrane protein TolC
MTNLRNTTNGLKTAVAFAFCMLGATATYAQERLSINEVLSSIEKNHPIVSMYRAEIRSMDEAAKGARSWMPPEVGAGFFMTPYNPKKWKAMDEMDPGMGSFMIAFQQMFPNRKKLNADAAYMESMSAAASEQKAGALNEVFAQAKQAYVEWSVIEKKLAVLNENEKVLDFMIKNAEIRYRNGLDKINAYYKAKAALGKIQNMKVMMENEKAQRSITLNTVMYREKNAPLDIDTTIIIKPSNYYVTDSIGFALRRSDIRGIEKEMLTIQLRQQSEMQNLRPQFGLRYEHMLTFGAQPQQFTLMGMVRLPFVPWASRMSKANVESYKWRQEALSNQRQMLINEATGMAAGMLAEMEAKEKQVRLYELNIIPALRNNYRTMLLAYEQNTEELFMLYDAWESLNMTQNDYLDQLQQLLTMQVELERILQIRN